MVLFAEYDLYTMCVTESGCIKLRFYIIYTKWIYFYVKGHNVPSQGKEIASRVRLESLSPRHKCQLPVESQIGEQCPRRSKTKVVKQATLTCPSLNLGETLLIVTDLQDEFNKTF